MKQESRRAVKHNHTAVSGRKHGFRNKASTAFPAGQVFQLQGKQGIYFRWGCFVRWLVQKERVTKFCSRKIEHLAKINFHDAAFTGRSRAKAGN